MPSIGAPCVPAETPLPRSRACVTTRTRASGDRSRGLPAARTPPLHFHACEQALTKGSDESALLVGTLPRGTVPERGGRRQRHTPLLHPGDDGSNARRHASVVAFCDT